MSTEIIVGLLSFAGMLIGSIWSNKLVIYRISQLEKKVDKHNSVMERTFILEEKVSNIERLVKK